MNNMVLDGLNNVFYFKDFTGFQKMNTSNLKCMLIDNQISGKIEDIEINDEIARNLTGNNVYYGAKQSDDGKQK